MVSSQKVLIDVRTPAEYSTGFLSADLSDAINIDFRSIDQLQSILSEQGIDIAKTDDITLYCRSGRRSHIALQTLKELGYSHARDIGGLEEARAILKREETSRGLEKGDVVALDVKREGSNDDNRKAREKSMADLLAGLEEHD
jgi:rhodanese-related sulfurtransferase